MSKPYSHDLRIRVAPAAAKGMTIRAVAAEYSVSPTFVQRMYHLYKQAGDVQPKQFGGYRRSRPAPCRDDLQARIKKRPSATLQELQYWLFQQKGGTVAISTLHVYIH